ncbi:MAG: DUF1249 domain-containing protein [Gammaproteobacteria bacterium]|nr:MAG: DUF1249 domain-containing protein [Gammaproteobacteria bacterium]
MAASRHRVDLSALLARCEINYWRLLGLLPARETGSTREFALGHGAHALRCRIEVQEAAPYTTILRLTQSAGSSAWLPALEMQVRLSHDATVAEVIACQGIRHIWPAYDYPNRAMHQKDEKTGWNRFLGDWLSLCHRHGREVASSLPEDLDA